MRDHGGNMDAAVQRFGEGDWIDLSTGINRRPYPVTMPPDTSWTALPTQVDQARLVETAMRAWRVAGGKAGLGLCGAQAAIQLVPHLFPTGRAAVLGPTYNEHGGSLRAQGWDVRDGADLDALRGTDLAIVVNPNNPDGRSWSPDRLLKLASDVGHLVVDESFADVLPDLSLLPLETPDNTLVLRSFGKFYGLAGLRLGFVFGSEPVVRQLENLAGPWPVSGPAIHLGCTALADDTWADVMRGQLTADAMRADTLASGMGWGLVGGTSLFRLYHMPDAQAAQDRLAERRIWSRIFPYSRHWLRLGLPGTEEEWARLAAALTPDC
ncbi:MAG: threonine-phosphate decarboxylase CobD [Paracoccaceae bacterium]